MLMGPDKITNPIMISWWGFSLQFESKNLMRFLLHETKSNYMIAKMLTWVCTKFKSGTENKDPFGNDPFIVL
jgi:hypothetical protein